MDFFARQDAARTSSQRLAWLFLFAVVMTVAGVNVITYWGVETYLGYQDMKFRQPDAGAQDTLRWQAHVLVTLGTLAIITLGSLWKTSQLSAGGPAVAEMLGGRLVAPGSSEPHERRLLNVVEEMAIASGVPMPQVYILPRERSINAFAAGHTHGDAVVAVTAGTLDLLSRDELQGVIGHEFSHILNGDMRFNLRLMGLVHGILVIGLIGEMTMRLATSSNTSSSSRERNQSFAPLLVAGIALLVIGYLGYFFGQLIKAAVSRQREFLADASGVQFTRNPAGLGGALKKLGAGYTGAFVRHPNTGEASHLFFGEAIGHVMFAFLATHPPLAERIRAIDPRWDGTYPDPLPLAVEDLAEPAAVLSAFAGRTRRTMQPESVSTLIGSVSPEQVRYGAQLIAKLPAPLTTAAHDAFSARAVVLVVLLPAQSEQAMISFRWLENAGDQALTQEVQRLLSVTRQLEDGSRLPLVELCLPALRTMSRNQRQAFLTTLSGMINADGRVDLEEFTLAKLVTSLLTPNANTVIAYHALRPLGEHLSILLSILARAGHPADDGHGGHLKIAFDTARARLDGIPELLPASDCRLERLDLALDTLAMASPGIKRRIVTACAWCIAADGTVSVREAELLRVVVQCLGCPMPPFADVAAA